MRYKLIITYDGKNYSGWQKQKNCNSIQDKIETALEILLKVKPNVVASGRTDAGVSALAQVAHFDMLEEDVKTSKACKIIENKRKFINSLNGILPSDIKVLACEETDIHARFSAKEKTYLYRLYKSNIELPLKFKRLRVDENIDVPSIKKCAKCLVGTHDYKNFCASNSDVDSTVRSIYSIKIIENNNDIDIYVTGNGFLYKMVRNIVGLLLKAGNKKISRKEFKNYAFGCCEKKFTAPPENLYLYNVKYK